MFGEIFSLHFTESPSMEQKKTFACELAEQMEPHPAHRAPNRIVGYASRSIGYEASPHHNVASQLVDASSLAGECSMSFETVATTLNAQSWQNALVK